MTPAQGGALRAGHHARMLTGVGLCAGVCLVAYGNSEPAKPRQSMASPSAIIVAHVPTYRLPTQVRVRGYVAGHLPEPFARGRIGEQKRVGGEPSAAGRERGPLEAAPLASFTMLGAMSRAGQTYGVVRLADRIHLVEVGQYLGQDHGQVIVIDEREIVLRELTRDETAGWKEKTSRLKLGVGA